MKIQKSSKKYILPLSILIALIFIGVLVFAFTRNRDPTGAYSPLYPNSVTSRDDKPIKEPVKTGESMDRPTTSEEVPVSSTGSIQISTLNQQDGFINALAETRNIQVDECIYIFTSDGARPVTRETKDSCDGVSIPQVEFDKVGVYKLVVTAYGEGKKISATKEIVIN